MPTIAVIGAGPAMGLSIAKVFDIYAKRDCAEHPYYAS
jgi:hypothetical protein